RMMEAEREDVTFTQEDDEFDPLMMVAAPPTLSENLLRDLHASLATEDHFIGEYLIGSLDERGFLDTTVDEVAGTLSVTAERVEAVLQQLQDVAPVGVGARDVPECLLLQLRRLATEGVTH